MAKSFASGTVRWISARASAAAAMPGNATVVPAAKVAFMSGAGGAASSTWPHWPHVWRSGAFVSPQAGQVFMTGDP